LYNDADMVWLADPFPLFEGHHDIFHSGDLAVVKPETCSHELPPPGKKGRTHLCSCMLFLRPTEGARLLLHLWIKELQGHPWTFHVRENDQSGFTRALNKTASQGHPCVQSKNVKKRKLIEDISATFLPTIQQMEEHMHQ
jgi:rhamnogalacturonan II specific xylosyltransferase